MFQLIPVGIARVVAKAEYDDVSRLLGGQAQRSGRKRDLDALEILVEAPVRAPEICDQYAARREPAQARAVENARGKLLDLRVTVIAIQDDDVRGHPGARNPLRAVADVHAKALVVRRHEELLTRDRDPLTLQRKFFPYLQ